MKIYIPKILLYSRLVFAIIVLALTFSERTHASIVVILLMYLGILSDVFDGIIARKFNISTINLRVEDTVIDLFFYISILGYVATTNPQSIIANIVLLVMVFSLEFLMYSICLIRFKRFPSPHAVLSKFWGIYIIVELTLLLLRVEGSHFRIALLIGLLVHLDRVLIYVLLKKWDHDIPSSFHANKLRQGIAIKRHKLFNG